MSIARCIIPTALVKTIMTESVIDTTTVKLSQDEHRGEGLGS